MQAGDLLQRGVGAAAEDPGVHRLDVFPAGTAGVHAVLGFFVAVEEEPLLLIPVAAEGAQGPLQGPFVPAEAAEKKPLAVTLQDRLRPRDISNEK